MSAIYNEIESYACGWLENLITAGHIANGRVERRSIKDLGPGDVAGGGQRHFFAGIGVWSHALRLAGVPDDASVWTGSCPCQPFSQAGAGGGTDDPRHLWPVWFPLIERCRPAIVLGEQVASPAGLEWLDAVFADLEGAGYSCAAADLCAAGVGAPHIRQRLYFVAYADAAGRREQWGAQLLDRERASQRHDTDGRGAAHWLGDSHCAGLEDRERERGDDGAELQATERAGGAIRGVGDAGGDRAGQHAGELPGDEGEHEERGPYRHHAPVAAGATRGFWAGADWLPCRDGKARPVEPGTFPLAHGAPARVGRLRAYGNAINAQVAATFIRAALEAA